MQIVRRFPESLDSLFRRACPFIDTVAVCMPRHLTGEERAEILTTCRGLQYHPKESKKRKEQIWFKVEGRKIRYWVVITLQQPTNATFDILNRIIEGSARPVPNRFQVALDLLTENREKAERLHFLILRYFYKPWHREVHEIRRIRKPGGHTDYMGFKECRSPWSMYSGRPSKISGGPACHIEWRFQGVDVLRELGITTLEDLKDYDYFRFLERRLRLCIFDMARLGKKLNGRTNRAPARKLSYSGVTVDERRAQLEMRRFAYSQDKIPRDIPFADFFLHFEKKNIGIVANYLINLDVSPFLPLRKRPIKLRC